MKRFLLALFFIVVSAGAYAQYRDVKLPEQPKQKGYRDYSTEDAGFWFAVEAEGGSSIMEHKKNMQYTNLLVTGGYRLNEYLRAGVGLGGRAYLHNADVRDSNNKFVMPLFVNVRGNIVSASERDGVPFWSLNVGGITSEGFFASPTIGYSFGGLRNNFLIGLSYTVSSFKDSKKDDVVYSYFGLKLGYEF